MTTSSKSSSSSPSPSFSYINMRGRQTVDLSSGGWTLRFPPRRDGVGKAAASAAAAAVRFYMDLQNDVERNDIQLVAGTRLYFLANGWREHDFETSRAYIMRPLEIQLREAQQQLEDRVSHDTGDRRLDGTDPIDTLLAYGDMAALVLDRDRKVAQWREAAKYYPTSDDLPEGPWPGSNEWLTLSDDNPILARVVVQQQQQQQQKKKDNEGTGGPFRSLLSPLTGGPMVEEYCMVGTWSAEAVVPDADWDDD